VGGRRESGFRRLPSRSHSSTRLHRNLTLSKLASCDAADIKSAEGREQNSLYVSSSSKVVSSLPHRPSRAVLVLLALAEQRRLNRLVNRAQVVDVGELFASEPLASVQSKQRRGTGEEGERTCSLFESSTSMLLNSISLPSMFCRAMSTGMLLVPERLSKREMMLRS
jgi:hypothetical protein